MSLASVQVVSALHLLIVVKAVVGRKLCSPLSPLQAHPQPIQSTVTAGTEDSMMGDHRKPVCVAQISRLCSPHCA